MPHRNVEQQVIVASTGYLPYLKSRRGVWREIVRYVQRDVGEVNTLVELGTGYCDFINQFPARRKIGYDLRADVVQFAEAGVDIRIENAVRLSGLEKNSVDLVFASNFMEHLCRKEHDVLLPRIHEILKTNGKMILIQPNYRLKPENYFDDPTHQTIFSDENIAAFLEKYGFKILKVIPKFLPFSMKSRLPKWAFLVRLYLRSPLKPMAGQMYIVSRKAE